MTTRFEQSMARSVAAADRVAGKRLTIVPMTPAGRLSAAKPDPNRAVLEVTGLLFVGRGTERLAGSERRSESSAQLMSGQAVAGLDLALFAASCDWPRQGDRIEAPDEPGAPVFDVAQAPDQSTGRLWLRLMRSQEAVT